MLHVGAQPPSTASLQAMATYCILTNFDSQWHCSGARNENPRLNEGMLLDGHEAVSIPLSISTLHQ